MVGWGVGIVERSWCKNCLGRRVLRLTKLEEEISWSRCWKKQNRLEACDLKDKLKNSWSIYAGIEYGSLQFYTNETFTFKTKTTRASKERLENVVGIKIWRCHKEQS